MRKGETMALANMTQAETDKYNREHCKHIADELHEYALGHLWKCDECGEVFNECDHEGWTDLDPCPLCHDEDARFEQQSVYDWLEDALSIESYTMDANGEYKGAEVCVTWGGPGIYVDTVRGMVNLYWWGDEAHYPLSDTAVGGLDEVLEEYFQMAKCG